jgi:hypothetical protein
VSLTEGIAGIDHLILAVTDLATATQELAEALGVVVEPGGEHPGWGTHNAIVRLGSSYLELIAVKDPDLARRRPRGQRLLASLESGSGWLGYALRTADIASASQQLRSRGLSVGEAEPGRRLRPDGTELRWQTASFDEAMWGGVLPFVIQHESMATAPAAHPVGATGIKALGVAVHDLQGSVPVYEQLFGLRPKHDEFAYVQARRASWRLPDGCFVRLMQPLADTSPVADHLNRRGQSLFVVGLAVANLESATAELARRGTRVSDPQPGRTVFLRDPVLGSAFALLDTS